MPVIPFPTSNAKGADLARAQAVARELILSERFRGRRADAARWTLTASPADVEMALAADDTLAVIRLRRAVRTALWTADLDTARRLRPALARLHASLTDVAPRHSVRGWHVALVVALVLYWAAPVPVHADDCASIRNSDRRVACEGRTRSRADCEAIRDADRRAACRAEARR